MLKGARLTQPSTLRGT